MYITVIGSTGAAQRYTAATVTATAWPVYHFLTKCCGTVPAIVSSSVRVNPLLFYHYYHGKVLSTGGRLS